MEVILFIRYFLFISTCASLFSSKKEEKNLESIIYDNGPMTGCLYVGEVKRQFLIGRFIPHGKGIMTYPDQRKYEGFFDAKYPHKPHGKGVMESFRLSEMTKTILDCTFSNGSCEGFGHLQVFDVVSLESSDSPERKAKRYDRIKLDYLGFFSNNMKNGFGEATTMNGNCVYSGYWWNDEKHTFPKSTIENINAYEVPRYSEQQHSIFDAVEVTREVEFMFSDVEITPSIEERKFAVEICLGNLYEGEFRNNKKRGYGKMTYKYGNRYTGSWLDDLPHGYGLLLYGPYEPELIKYEGYFVNGQREGFGQVDFKYGATCLGYFERDQRHGTTTCTFRHYNDNRIFRGTYVSGVLRNSYGTLTWPNGDEYKGTVKNGARHSFKYDEKSTMKSINTETGEITETKSFWKNDVKVNFFQRLFLR